MTETLKDHRRLLENLKILQKIHSASALASALGINKNTWTNRMREPWRLFSYDDFRVISRYCKVEFSALMEGELKLR